LSSVFTEWWVSLLVSVCRSWCPRFSPRFPVSGSEADFELNCTDPKRACFELGIMPFVAFFLIVRLWLLVADYTASKIRLGGVHGAGDIGVKHLNCNSESPEMDPDLVRRVQTGLIIITWLFEKKADPQPREPATCSTLTPWYEFSREAPFDFWHHRYL
jgi:hypothetical protein